MWLVRKCQWLDSGLDIQDIYVLCFHLRHYLTSQGGDVEPTLEISELGSEGRIRLSGELDLFTAPHLSEVLSNHGSDSTVVLDLRELTFLDSSGLAVLLRFASSLNGNGPLVLLDPAAWIERVFEVAGLAEHPDIEVRHTERNETLLSA